MPKIQLSKSLEIHAPIERVYDVVADITTWPRWSPWLMMEAECQVDFSDDGTGYRWDGVRVGAGHMTRTQTARPKSVRYDLTFERPWKSQAKIGMDLTPTEAGAIVTWSMDSRLPFYLFFLKKPMHVFIGMDYDRGLLCLKDYIEHGQVMSHLEIIGPRKYPGSHYMGIRGSCALEDLGSAMQTDFKRLMNWAVENDFNYMDCITVYEDISPIKGRCTYVAAVRYQDTPETIPMDFVFGTQAAADIFTVTHTGPYRHLGNGWAMIQNLIQNKVFQPMKAKAYAPFETYGNSPAETDEAALITRINYPVKKV